MIIFFCLILLQHSLCASEQTPHFSGQTVNFKLTGQPFQPNESRTITTPLEVANTFEAFKGIIEDLGSDDDLLFTVDNAPIGGASQSDIINVINTLFIYVKQIQKLEPEKKYKKEAIDTRKNIYQNSPLSHSLLGITYASEYKLNKNAIDNLTDIYIEKLFNTNFIALGPLQNQLLALPGNYDLDKLIAKKLMHTVLQKEYSLKRYSNGVVNYLTSDYYSTLDKDGVLTLYKPAKKLSLKPIISKFSSRPPFLPYLCFKNKENPAANTYLQPEPKDIPVVGLATDGSTMIGIRSDGSIESYILPFRVSIFSTNTRLMNTQKIPSFGKADTAAIDFNEQGTWCVGCNKSIVLFKIGWQYQIKDLKTHDIPTVADGNIIHISMLDNAVAITYKTLSDEFEYSFFDIQKQSFVKDHPGQVKLSYRVPNKNMIGSKMILIRDHQQFINRETILDARFNEVNEMGGYVKYFV